MTLRRVALSGGQPWSERASDVQTTDDSLGWAEAEAEAEVSVEAGEGGEDMAGLGAAGWRAGDVCKSVATPAPSASLMSGLG